MDKVMLRWKRFETFRKAREAFRNIPCIYALTDRDGRALKIGQSKDLWRRYWGGTGYTVDAAMHGSGNSVFVAPASGNDAQRRKIEAVLIYTHKPLYSVQNREVPPLHPLSIEHSGEVPKGMA